MVFQNPDNQFIGGNRRDDVAFGLENQGVPLEEMKKRVSSSVIQLGWLNFLKRNQLVLSGGQK